MHNDSAFPAIGMHIEKVDLRSFKAMSLEVIERAYTDNSLTLQLLEQQISSGVIVPPSGFYCPLIRYGRTLLYRDDLFLEVYPHDGMQLDKALKPFMKESKAVREKIFYEIFHNIYYALDFLYGRIQPGEFCIRSHLRLSMSTVYLSNDRKVYLGTYSLPSMRTENVLTASKNDAFQLDRTMLLVILRHIVGILSLAPLHKDSKLKELLDMTQNSASYTFEAILAVIGIQPISFTNCSTDSKINNNNQNQGSSNQPLPVPNLTSNDIHVLVQAPVVMDASHHFNGAMDTLNYLSTSQLRLRHLTRSVNTSIVEHDDTATDLERTSTGFYSSLCEESMVLPHTYDRALIPFETFLDIKNYYSGETRKVLVSAEKICPTRLYVANIYHFIKDNSIKMLMQSRRVLTLLTHEDLYLQLCKRSTPELLNFLTEEENMKIILQSALNGIFIERQSQLPSTIKNILLENFPSFIGFFFNTPAVATAFLDNKEFIAILFSGLNRIVNQQPIHTSPKDTTVDSDVWMCCLANLRLVFSILYQNYEMKLFKIFHLNKLNWNNLLLQMATCPIFSKEISPIMKSSYLQKEFISGMIQELHQISPTSSFSYCKKMCICEHLRTFSQVNSALFYSFSTQIVALYKLIIILLSCENDNIQIANELINIVITYISRLLYLDVYGVVQKKSFDLARMKTVRQTIDLMSTIINSIASTLGKVATFSARDTIRVYYGLLFICRMYCSIGYMFKYITDLCVPNHNTDIVANPFSWSFYEVSGSAHVVGSSYLGLGDITEWKAYLNNKNYQNILKNIFILIRGFLSPDLSAFLQKINNTKDFINNNNIQCLLARIRHAIIELEALISVSTPPVSVLKDIGFVDRLMYYVERHRQGVEYHTPIERPIELVLIISTLHVVVNFAIKATLTDVYISRCALMNYNVLNIISDSTTTSYISQKCVDSVEEKIEHDDDDDDDDDFSPELLEVKKRSPTNLLKYCRLLMDKSILIEPFCVALGLNFSVVQEAITAFDLIHIFDSYSPSSSIKL